MDPQEQLDAFAKDIADKHWEDVEYLTKLQITEALVQAFKSGDFARHVQIHSRAQGVTYIPFRAASDMKNAIKRLIEKLNGSEIWDVSSAQIIITADLEEILKITSVVEDPPITEKEAFDHDVVVYCGNLEELCQYHKNDYPHRCMHPDAPEEGKIIFFDNNLMAYVSKCCPMRPEADAKTDKMVSDAFDEACANPPKPELRYGA